ncbi:DoxX family protein [Pelagibius sp.]|uniref:DoxX family protein n=1 Tax=Pelagibius sp. TaxID=1931238 RepID=UPI003BB14801
MFDTLLKYADAPARALMALIFILSGYSKIGAFEATQGYMTAFGLPAALLIPTIAFEIGAGLLLLIGFGARYVALALSGFCLLTALIFHRAFDDQIQMVMFLKNLAMTGGFLLLAKTGAPGLSLDGWRAACKGV